MTTIPTPTGAIHTLDSPDVPAIVPKPTPGAPAPTGSLFPPVAAPAPVPAKKAPAKKSAAKKAPPKPTAKKASAKKIAKDSAKASVKRVVALVKATAPKSTPVPKGGPRVNSGPKTKYDGEVMHAVSFKATKLQHAALVRIGGGQYLRDRLDELAAKFKTQDSKGK